MTNGNQANLVATFPYFSVFREILLNTALHYCYVGIQLALGHFSTKLRSITKQTQRAYLSFFVTRVLLSPIHYLTKTCCLLRAER